MTWRDPPPFNPKLPKKSKRITPEQIASGGSEHASQAALFAWVADNVGKYPALKYMFAIPNGGLRDVRVASSLKAEGVKAGVPDIFLPSSMHSGGPLNFKQYHGLFIEMKWGRNKTSDTQFDYIEYLTQAGYYCKVCYNWEEAKDTLIAYLEGKL